MWVLAWSLTFGWALIPKGNTMKHLLILLLLLGIHRQAFSQLQPYQWRLGISGGYSNYYGDLSPYPISSLGDYQYFFRLFNYNENYVHDYSYAVSLERRLSNSLSLQLSAGKYSISMNDRYQSPSNRLQLDAPNFSRALNFKTDIRDWGLGLVLKTDNGRLLKQDAFMAPYLNLGMGWLDFKVFGDLYDDNGQPYDYSQHHLVQDGNFETRLDRLHTELPEGYPNTSFYAQAGIGLRFRLGGQLEIFAQSDFKHAFTDYLDDVSGLYREDYDTPEQQYAAMPAVVESPLRGKNDGRKDWYIYHSIGLKFSFSPMKNAFRATRISPGVYTPMESFPALENQKAESPDSLPSSSQGMDKLTNYFTFIQLEKPYNRDSSYYAFKILEADVSILHLENKLLNHQNGLDRLNSQRDSLIIEQKTALEAADSVAVSPVLATLQKAIEDIDNQLEDAIEEREALEEGLAEAHQNKELYQNAYRLSIERASRGDSLAMADEILELPGLVRQALAQGTAITRIQDTTANLQTFSSSGAWSARNEEGDNPAPTDEKPLQFYPGQENRDYQELLTQERARSAYLLRELENYKDWYARSSNRERAEEDLRSLYSERRNNAAPDVYYRIDDYRPERRSTHPGYVLPIVVPNTSGIPSAPQQENNDRSVDWNTFNWQPRPFQPLVRFDAARRPLYFPQVTDRKNQDLKEATAEMNKPAADTARTGLNPYNTEINSKVEIFFDNDQAYPNEQELQKLQPLESILKNNPAIGITISGFADNTGRLGYNLNLIDQRTSNIKDLLVEKYGIDAERISILPGGLIVREDGQKSSSTDRKVEVWVREEKPTPAGSIDQ